MNKKKMIRSEFRNTCFKRDNYSCIMCGFKSSPEKAEKDLDCHHISNRNLLPHGGYVVQNGISLCDVCHELAEIFHVTGTAHFGYSPEDLYNKIGSSYEEAVKASELL